MSASRAKMRPPLCTETWTLISFDEMSNEEFRLCYYWTLSVHETLAYFSVRNTMVSDVCFEGCCYMVNEPFYLTLSFIEATTWHASTLQLWRRAKCLIYCTFSWHSRRVQIKWAKSVWPESCINKYWRWNARIESQSASVLYECKTMQTSEAYIFKAEVFMML